MSIFVSIVAFLRGVPMWPASFRVLPAESGGARSRARFPTKTRRIGERAAGRRVCADAKRKPGFDP
jgi:hypothetical protein